MEKLVKPAEHFRNYILSLLGDRDYEKIIEAVSKIYKALEKDLTPSSFSNSDVSPSVIPSYYNPLPPVDFPPPPPTFFIFTIYPLYPEEFGSRYNNQGFRRGGSSRFCTFCNRWGHTLRYCFVKRKFDSGIPRRTFPGIN